VAQDCSGHGRCETLSGKCHCEAGFYEDDCSKRSCPSDCRCVSALIFAQCCAISSSHLTRFRSGNGQCNHLDGKCQCWPGYEGDSCDTAPNRMYRESWGLFFSICLLGTVFIGLVCASMTRLRAVPEPFVAIVFGILIGAAVNIFSVNPGTLRNMQVCPPHAAPLTIMFTRLGSQAPSSSTSCP
jgi:hypothetical protein